MPEYRRFTVPGSTVFLTLVTGRREPLFADPLNVERLKSALCAVRGEWPFEVAAGVVLPDHLHFLWTLPPGDAAYSKRAGRMKVKFTSQLDERLPVARASQVKHRESGVWQRRFWEHTIRDEDDFLRHLDYIHYNPVRHGYATCPPAWPHSSFAKWVGTGDCVADWGCSCGGRPVNVPAHDDIVARAGE